MTDQLYPTKTIDALAPVAGLATGLCPTKLFGDRGPDALRWARAVIGGAVLDPMIGGERYDWSTSHEDVSALAATHTLEGVVAEIALQISALADSAHRVVTRASDEDAGPVALDADAFDAECSSAVTAAVPGLLHGAACRIARIVRERASVAVAS